MPGEALTKKQPMIEAMIETPPRTSGYSTTSVAWSGENVRTPSSITATAVTA